MAWAGKVWQRLSRVQCEAVLLLTQRMSYASIRGLALESWQLEWSRLGEWQVEIARALLALRASF